MQIETLDFTQSKPRGPRGAQWLARGARARPPSTRARFARAASFVARFHQLLDAAGPFLHPCWRTWTDADLSPKLPPTLICFPRTSRRRARFGGLRQSIPARLFVEPLGFPVDAQPDAAASFNRVIRQTIRLPLETLEFGRRGWRSEACGGASGAPEYRGVQRPPRRLAASPPPSAMRSAVARGRNRARKVGQGGPVRFRQSPSPTASRALAPLTHRTRKPPRLRRRIEQDPRGAAMGQPRERFQVEDRRIEPRGGRLRAQARPFVSAIRLSATLRASSAIFPRAAYFSRKRRGDQGPRLLRLGRCEPRRGIFCAWGGVERPSPLPRPSAVAPLLDQLARLRLPGLGRPRCVERANAGQNPVIGTMMIEPREEARRLRVARLEGRALRLCRPPLLLK